MESIDKISVMLEELFKIAPYSLDQAKKEEIITPILKELTSLHYHNCKEFQKIVDPVFNLNDDRDFYQQNNGEASVGEFANIKSLSDVPFIPVRLFKLFELLSVPKEDVCKILTSSGTSSQVKSKIFLDKVNLLNQTKTLNHIIASFLGSSRLPMVIFDTSMIRKDRTMFSARGGGVIGFSLFGRKPIYALDENMELDIEALEAFFREHQDERVLFFGYTFMIWQYIVKVLEEKNIKFNFKNAVLFHTGGWKKLQSEAVEPKAFIERVKNVLGNVEVVLLYELILLLVVAGITVVLFVSVLVVVFSGATLFSVGSVAVLLASSLFPDGIMILVANISLAKLQTTSTIIIITNNFFESFFIILILLRFQYNNIIYIFNFTILFLYSQHIFLTFLLHLHY